jgi:FMS-like tyrosine kinase 1
VVEVERDDDGNSRTLFCGVSNLFFTSLFWYRQSKGEDSYHLLGLDDDDEGIAKEEEDTDFSFRATLRFANYTNDYDGLYQCRGMPRHNLEEIHTGLNLDPFPSVQTIEMVGEPLTEPFLPRQSGSTVNGTDLHVEYGGNVTLVCNVEGNPAPTITWSRDGLSLSETRRREEMKSNNKRFDYDRHWHLTHGGTRLQILEVSSEDLEGVYVCTAENTQGSLRIHANLDIKSGDDQTLAVALGIGLTVTLLLALALFCGLKYYHSKYRETEKKLSPKDIEELKRGDPTRLAAMGDTTEPLIDNLYTERAQMLPYDEKVEFPFTKLDMGSLLGSGEYGRVLKGRAKGIFGGNNITTVAVKTLKINPEREKLNALMSELKILIHIGKHPNLVNLLGSCTERLADMELYVILEYCRHGNLLHYLRKSRRAFSSITLQRNRSIGSRHSRLPAVTSPTPGSDRSSQSVFFRSNSPRY